MRTRRRAPSHLPDSRAIRAAWFLPARGASDHRKCVSKLPLVAPDRAEMGLTVMIQMPTRNQADHGDWCCGFNVPSGERAKISMRVDV